MFSLNTHLFLPILKPVCLQHCSMASVAALIIFLPVVRTCPPQKAGNTPVVLMSYYPASPYNQFTYRNRMRIKIKLSEDSNSFVLSVFLISSFQIMSWCHVSPTPSSPTSQSVHTAGTLTSCLSVESVTLEFTAWVTTVSSSQT